MSDKNHHGHHQSSYNHSGGSLAGKESRKRKKKFTLFYKINFFTVLFISLILLYFVILVSAKPKSFPYITQKIKEHLSQNFSDDVVIENSYISFTAHGSFKIMAINVKINKSKTVDDKNNNKTEFEIPKIEAEFPIYNFLLFRFTPSKIKITDPSIIFYKSQDYLETKGIANEINSVENKSLIYVAPLLSFLTQLKMINCMLKFLKLKILSYYCAIT